MFYPSDFEIKRTKEQDCREHVERAQVDRLIQSIQPHHAGWFSRSALSVTQSLGHVLLGVGIRLEKLDATDLILPKPVISSR